MKKIAGNFIILHMCTKKQSSDVRFMRYKVKWTKIFVILGNFLPFYLLNNLENQILKKWKENLEMSSFHTCGPKITVIWCMLPEICNETDRTICHFGTFFAHILPPKQPRKSEFWKNERNTRDITILHIWSHDVWFVWKSDTWRRVPHLMNGVKRKGNLCSFGILLNI